MLVYGSSSFRELNDRKESQAAEDDITVCVPLHVTAKNPFPFYGQLQIVDERNSVRRSLLGSGGEHRCLRSNHSDAPKAPPSARAVFLRVISLCRAGDAGVPHHKGDDDVTWKKD